MSNKNAVYLSNGNMVLTDEEKADMIKKAACYYEKFMKALKIDVSDDPNSKDTPMRVAKMYVNELFKGRYIKEPEIKSFPNDQLYDEIIFTNCQVPSICAHHHVIIQNHVFMGVLSNPDPEASSELIGLSKYTRIAEWIASRPTIQENMTAQIHDYINKICKNNLGVMVYIIGQHGCTVHRGVKQTTGKMITSRCSGYFRERQHVKEEFLSMVRDCLNYKQ